MDIRNDPFEAMERQFDQMRSLFGADGWTGSKSNLRLEPTDEGYVAMADLPGFEKEDITVRYDEGDLSVSAVREASEERDSSFRSRSRRVHETVQVPGTVSVDEITATYRNGVLEITLPTETTLSDDEHVISVK